MVIPCPLPYIGWMGGLTFGSLSPLGMSTALKTGIPFPAGYVAPSMRIATLESYHAAYRQEL